MQWLQPWSFLWAALIIPSIIFFYLLKRRYTDRVIASTMLWQRVLKEREVTRPWQRLNRHLLLFLQLLVAVLLIAALARPALPTEGVTTPYTVLLMDTSGSMLAEEEGTTRLEVAKKKAKALVDSMEAGQVMTVVAVGAPPKVAVAGTGDKKKLKAGIDALDVTYSPGDVEQSLSFARALASRHGKGEVVLISDGSGWELKQDLAPDRMIAIGKNKENVSVAGFSVTAFGRAAKGLARLENKGTRPAQGTLWLYDDKEQVLDTRTVQIAPRHFETVTWGQLPPAQYYHVKWEAEGRTLQADNEGWAVPAAPARHDVLFISKGNDFLEKALRLNDRLNIVKAVGKGTDREKPLSDYSFAVIDGKETALPESGNALIIHPPDTFAGWKWGKDVRLIKAVRQTPHPILEHVTLEDVYIAKARAVEPPPGWEVVARSGEIPLVLVRENGDQRLVVLTFDLHQSDLPLKPQFPVFIHQLAGWLLPSGGSGLTAGRIGERAAIPVSAHVEKVTVIAPSGAQQTFQPEQMHIDYIPREVGLHKVATEEKGKTEVQHFVVPFPSEETDIQPNANLLTTSGSGKEKGKAEQGVAEVAHWVVLAALVVLALEWVVYGRGY